MDSDDQIIRQVSQFIMDKVHPRKYRPKTGRVITSDTRLEEDLWLTGEDATAFMASFFAKFNVSPEGFDPSSFFFAEGFHFPWLTPFLYRLVNRKPMPVPTHDLTVGDLVRCVRAGKWVEPDKSQARYCL